jgi:signal transduction histidine kinase
MPPTRHLARLAERGAEELATALESIADAARSGTGFGAALISRVDGDCYRVMALSVNGHAGLEVGCTYQLTETLCSLVVAQGEAVELADAVSADHRAALLGLGSYAGVPVRRINGELFGTLAILDPESRESVHIEAEFLRTLSRLATHEIGLQDNLQRLVDEVSGAAPEIPAEDQVSPDPVGDLQGLEALLAAVLRQIGAHDEPRLRRRLSRETSRFAHDLIDTLMKQRHLALLPGDVEPWGTDVDRMLVRGVSLLPGNQGSRIRVHAGTQAVADIPRRHLERILVNLVYRAWRSSAPPSPITLSARVRPGAVEIIVEDNGPAVAAEDVPTMFDRGGRGLLGLSVIKELATRAGGSVRYERHTPINRIIVRIPLAGAPRPVGEEASEPSASATSPAGD